MMKTNSETQLSGLIFKSIGGLYHVKTDAGIFECKARGIFRHRDISPCAGDNVIISLTDGPIIEEIKERKNALIRPPLANLDQLIFVISTCEPSPNLSILDKFIAISEYKNIEPIIVITKLDMLESTNLEEIYTKVGIKVLKIDYRNNNPSYEVDKLLAGKISAFTGNSGVGKSTLLNALDHSLKIVTNEISKKLGRGKHTTRQVELYQMENGGYIADTPGFSTLETNRYDIIHKEYLSGCFREFSTIINSNKCKYMDCSHTCEQGCSVIAAVKNGEISNSRYNSYKIMYEEALKIKDWDLKNVK